MVADSVSSGDQCALAVPGSSSEGKSQQQQAGQGTLSPPLPPQQRQQQTGSVPDQGPELSRGRRVLRTVAWNMHFFTFGPLILVQCLQDVNMLAAACGATGLALLALALSCAWKRLGFYRIWPKKYDLFNICLYGALIPASIWAHGFVRLYIGLYTNAGNAGFMWATILLPCCRNFVLDSALDRVPPLVGEQPLFRRMAVAIAATWATALTIMTAASVIPVVLFYEHPTRINPAVIVCSYVFGLGPLAAAPILQLLISRHYRPRLTALKASMAAKHAGEQKAQPGGSAV